MYINNELRDIVHQIAVSKGFWDNVRPYELFTENLMAEFDEVLEELKTNEPTRVYSKDGIKPEGAPTELADIVIFILDYFGGCNPKIDIDEDYLLQPDEYYKNDAYYKKARKKKPYDYFSEIKKECFGHISKSLYYYAINQNNIFTDCDGNVKGVPLELHFVLKRILEVCEVFGINFEKELIDKIRFNGSRPAKYRVVGDSELLETDYEKVYQELLKAGFGMYKQIDEIIKARSLKNAEVLKNREESSRLSENSQLPKK